METSSGGGGGGGTEEIESKRSFKLSVFTKTFYTEDLIIRWASASRGSGSGSASLLNDLEDQQQINFSTKTYT